MCFCASRIVVWLRDEVINEKDFNILALSRSEKNVNSKIDVSKEHEMIK